MLQFIIAAVFAVALQGCSDPPRSPNSQHKANKPVTNVPSLAQPAKTNFWHENSLPEPLAEGAQYKAEFVDHLYATSKNYRWNKLDDKMQQISIGNLDGNYADFNGLYHPHPNRPFLWVKQTGDFKAGLLKEGENFVIRYYKQARRDNVEALTRCWWIGAWNINTKSLKPQAVMLKELTWHCQSYNTFTQIPERGWQGEVGNKIYISNKGADRQVVDK